MHNWLLAEADYAFFYVFRVWKILVGILDAYIFINDCFVDNFVKSKKNKITQPFGHIFRLRIRIEPLQPMAFSAKKRNKVFILKS